MTETLRAPAAFVPPQLQLRFAEAGLVPIDVALRTATFDATARRGRLSPDRHVRGYPGNGASRGQIRVFDLAGSIGPTAAAPIRISGDGKSSGDPIVDGALSNAMIVQEFYSSQFGHDTITGSGHPLDICVHYGKSLNNALWDGDQLLFGDGCGTVFKPFALSLEVMAHELSHAKIDVTSGLTYQDESGALNESFADVMAAMIVQRHHGLDVDQANWIVGTEVLVPDIGVHGVRAFTAQSHLGSHPRLVLPEQPKHYADYVNDPDDNGSVHLNSGIPNHAFYLAATRLGGKAWERAGRIWFDAFVKLAKDDDFAAAAYKTVWTAQVEFKDEEAGEAFREAWSSVGINIEV